MKILIIGKVLLTAFLLFMVIGINVFLASIAEYLLNNEIISPIQYFWFAGSTITLVVIVYATTLNHLWGIQGDRKN